MKQLAQPAASRLRRPSARDPRLLIGLLLVACSVALGSWVVARADRRVEVWATAGQIASGRALTGQDLLAVPVDLGTAGGHYLPVTDGLPPDLVALRPLDAGELVPRSAVGSRTLLDLRPVAVPMAGPPPAELAPGSLVDLWIVPQEPTGAAASAQEEQASSARVLAEGLEVAESESETGVLAVGEAASVHVLVPRAQLPAVLDALAGPDEVRVVLVPGTGPAAR